MKRGARAVKTQTHYTLYLSGTVCQVSVLDKGSRPQHAQVLLEGVKAIGVIDNGADITSMGEDMYGSCSKIQEE